MSISQTCWTWWWIFFPPQGRGSSIQNLYASTPHSTMPSHTYQCIKSFYAASMVSFSHSCSPISTLAATEIADTRRWRIQGPLPSLVLRPCVCLFVWLLHELLLISHRIIYLWNPTSLWLRTPHRYPATLEFYQPASRIRHVVRYKRVCAHTHAHTHKRMHTRTHTYISMRTNVHTPVLTHTYTHTQPRAHICTRTHTRTPYKRMPDL